jgi:hypothetical protein
MTFPGRWTKEREGSRWAACGIVHPKHAVINHLFDELPP